MGKQSSTKDIGSPFMRNLVKCCAGLREVRQKRMRGRAYCVKTCLFQHAWNLCRCLPVSERKICRAVWCRRRAACWRPQVVLFYTELMFTFLSSLRPPRSYSNTPLRVNSCGKRNLSHFLANFIMFYSLEIVSLWSAHVNILRRPEQPSAALTV